jgi:birA, biotin-[acetyl-CoA-carboxylase] ligase region
MNIIWIPITPSTNSLLKEMTTKETLPEGTCLVTDNQTSGRGQTNNSWESEVGKNLCFSIVFYPSFLPIQSYFLLSKAVALGVYDALSIHIKELTLKWPNDIYYQEKKLGGVLFENNITESKISQSIVGIGINVNQEFFLSDAPNPISLKQLTGKNYFLDELLRNILSSILFRYEELKKGKGEQIETNYFQALYRREAYHFYQDKQGIFSAKIEKVDNSGFLYLITKEGEKRKYAFKEVIALRQ